MGAAGLEPRTSAWAAIKSLPVPAWTLDSEVVGKGLSTLGKGTGSALIAKAREMEVKLPAELNDPGAALTPRLVVGFLRGVAGHFFPLLAGGDHADGDRANSPDA